MAIDISKTNFRFMFSDPSWGSQAREESLDIFAIFVPRNFPSIPPPPPSGLMTNLWFIASQIIIQYDIVIMDKNRMPWMWCTSSFGIEKLKTGICAWRASWCLASLSAHRIGMTFKNENLYQADLGVRSFVELDEFRCGHKPSRKNPYLSSHTAGWEGFQPHHTIKGVRFWLSR